MAGRSVAGGVTQVTSLVTKTHTHRTTIVTPSRVHDYITGAGISTSLQDRQDRQDLQELAPRGGRDRTERRGERKKPSPATRKTAEDQGSDPGHRGPRVTNQADYRSRSASFTKKMRGADFSSEVSSTGVPAACLHCKKTVVPLYQKYCEFFLQNRYCELYYSHPGPAFTSIFQNFGYTMHCTIYYRG